MILPDGDLFEVWRLALGTICGIYALVVTLTSLWYWLAYFSGPERRVRLMRSYVILHLLRLRWSRFKREFLSIGSYLVLLAVLLYFHRAG